MWRGRAFQVDRCKGFSLVELLVVIAIIGVLISVLVPALGMARDAGRAARCGSNLRGMMVLWGVGITEEQGVIPVTFGPMGFATTWGNMLDRAVPEAQVLNAPGGGKDPNSFNHCPQLQSRQRPIAYSFVNKWGYAINTVWTPGVKPVDNATSTTHRRWDQVLRPSDYPWFTDPATRFSTDTYHAARRVPDFTFANLGLGAWHGGDNTTNVAYADGSVRPANVAAVVAQTAEPDQFGWFDND